MKFARPLAFTWGIALFLLARLASAIELPTVKVEFVCGEENYCSLRPEYLRDLQTSFARELRVILGRCFQCFKFVETGGTYRLRINLGRRDPSTSPENPDDVVFWMSIYEGAELLAMQDVWVFRSKDEYIAPLGNVERFKNQLCLNLRSHVVREERLQGLTDSVLSKVRLADCAYPIPITFDWAMPFSKEETGLANGSLFRVETSYKDPAGNTKEQTFNVRATGVTASADLPKEWRGKILAANQDFIDRWPPEIQVGGVFLAKPLSAIKPVLEPHAPPGRPPTRKKSDCLFQ